MIAVAMAVTVTAAPFLIVRNAHTKIRCVEFGDIYTFTDYFHEPFLLSVHFKVPLIYYHAIDSLSSDGCITLMCCMHYSELAKHDEYGSVLEDMAHGEMPHAKHLKHILKAESVEIPDMCEHWEAAEHSLYGDGK